MKKLNIFSIILAFTVLLAGCAKEISVKSLNELELSQTYVSIAPAGSTATVTITANTGWAVDTETIPEWLTLSATSGAAGSTTTVNISAPACEYGREAVLQIKADVHTQFLTVRQGDMVAEEVSCKVAMTGTAGKTYKVTGAVTKIVNTSYGNLYISDGSITDEDYIDENACYIYGTLDAKGAEKNFLSLGIEVGDVITVEGPLSYYGTTPELVNVTVSKIVKSLLKLSDEPASEEVGKEGGLVSVRAAYKGNGAYATMLKGAESWITLQSTEYIAGVPSKLVKEPADTMIFNFNVSANEDDTRIGTIQISSSNAGGTTNAIFTVTQASGLDCYPLPYEETFESGIGAWTISDVKGLESGNVWFHDSQYKQMKASGYVDDVNNETESDLVSPRIDLTSATVASLSFDHAAKYGASLDDEFTLWVSKDNGESWSQVLIPVYTDKKSWNFVTNTVSLNPFVGNQILVKFKYKSYTTGGSTLEIKNVKIVAENVEVTNIAQLQGLAINSDTRSDFSATLTDALVTYVNDNNVFIQDATGGVLVYKSGHGLTAGDKINGAVSGQITIYGGFAEITDIDVTSATVSHGESVTPTVITVAELIKTFPRHISCQIKLEGVSLDKALGSNRNATLKQGESEIAAYAKVKNTVTIEAGVEGDLICYPCIYNTPDAKQVGIWEAAHFTAK